MLSNGTTFTGAYSGQSMITARFSSNAIVPGSGDIDGDGVMTATDALLALRYAMGIVDLTPEQLAGANVNGDGLVDASDALIILRMAMDLVA